MGLVSCGGDNGGFPNSVNFPKEGGRMTVTGDITIIGIDILNYNGDGSTGYPIESDSIVVTTEWLTAKSTNRSSKIELIAQPNNKSKNRKLYVYGYSGDSECDIKVTQD
ncbi:MAG: hypothetical protein NC453_10090 [Muribaculum sp.]|nr:hypothetical protein [Muribaculum sp.]